MMNYRFGGFELQPSERRLLREGEPVTLAPRAFDVLLALVERAGQLVTKEVLLELVWPKLVVEEANVQVQVSTLRRVIGPEAIATVPGRGYRFTLAPQRVTVASPSTPELRNHNLPQQLTSFIGREKEIAEIDVLLARTRLLTLTGSGGCGKTRLCLRVAADSLECFPDGAWFVELAPLADPGLVPQTVATVLGIKEVPGESIIQTLTKHLKPRRLLLVLDNCEHLLDSCAKVADLVLSECLSVKILATTREALGIAGEQTYRVPSLTLPDRNDVPTPQILSECEAAQLFIERALLVRRDFQVTHQNAAALASVCCHLDGIPLAIELAAARVRTLAVEEIDGKLQQRFRLLTGGSRTALPRHQTLRSLIDWSYDLLHEPEKLFLQRLSVFAGGWTLAAAEEVCAGEGIEHRDVLDLLTSLADKSLVVPEQEDAQTRYRLLETVRQYARDRLEDTGGSAAVRVRHRDYYLALAEKAAPKLTGAEQVTWLRSLEEEHENLRAGLAWSLAEVETGGGLRLCGALYRFWETRGHLSEGRDSCMRVLGKGVKERTPERAKALNTAGVLAQHQGDYPAARAQLEESLAIRRELGDRRGIAGSLGNLGNVAKHQSDFASARALLEECLAIQRELGGRWGIGRSLNNLAVIVYEQGDFASARWLYEESLAILRELGDRSGIAVALGNLGSVRFEQRDYPAARALYEESLAIRRELGDRFGIAVTLEELATLVAALGGALHAARIWSAAERLRAEISSPLPPNERPRYDGAVAKARAALNDDAAFDSAWQEGRALTLEHAIELALEETVERP